jgi:enoyl-CoA hydratase
MSDSVVRLDHDTPTDDVVTITINRPDARNALNAEVRSGLMDALDQIDAMRENKLIILTGASDGDAFVAGADLSELQGRDATEQRSISHLPRVFERVCTTKVPVIAKITGHALGGGLELAMACDLRIAQSDATLGQPEITLGLIPGGGGTQRLPRLVGEGYALQMILTGQFIDAAEAEAVGLVDAVYSPDAIDAEVKSLATAIAEQPLSCINRATAAVRAASRMPLDAGIEYERELFVQLFSTSTPHERMAAFLDRS